MDHFNYKNGELFAENVAVSEIIEKVGSPTYVYSKNTFLDHLQKMQKAYADLDTLVCFAVKSCDNTNILRFMANAGSGFDIVSGGELFKVRKANAPMDRVFYAGVGKKDQEIIEALQAGIGYFNIESVPELENLIAVASKQKVKTKAAIRVNPDVEYKTHRYITTGKKETKFGIDIDCVEDVFEKYASNNWVEMSAIHVHLGSGGKTIDPFVDYVKKALPLIEKLRSKGYNIDTINLGGGYGADYESNTVPSAEVYAAGLVPLLKDKGLKLVLEPGKSISANAGILLSEVIYTKTSGSKDFVIVDAAMNDLIRPALYQAFHFIWPTKVQDAFVPSERKSDFAPSGTKAVDVVGPICEGGDFFAKDRALPPLERGDSIAIFTAGAYSFTMSSNYNSRGRAAEVLVDGDSFHVIRRRETYEDLIALEQ